MRFSCVTFYYFHQCAKEMELREETEMLTNLNQDRGLPAGRRYKESPKAHPRAPVKVAVRLALTEHLLDQHLIPPALKSGDETPLLLTRDYKFYRYSFSLQSPG